MSRNRVRYYRPDLEPLGYGVFQGVTGVVQPWILDDPVAAFESYRDKAFYDQQWDKLRSCSHDGYACLVQVEPSTIEDAWPGTWCPECEVFTGPHSTEFLCEHWGVDPRYPFFRFGSV